MEIRLYNKALDEAQLMKMIENEEGWTYWEAHISERYRRALENSITYVAYEKGILCGYSRSLEDFGLYVYVCDLLVRPEYRGKDIGRKLMECIYADYPGQVVYVMSGVDEYYKKLGYQRAGSVFEVPDRSEA